MNVIIKTMSRYGIIDLLFQLHKSTILGIKVLIRKYFTIQQSLLSFETSKYILKQQIGLQICCVNNLMNSKNVDRKLHFNHIIYIEKITTNISTDILRYPQHQCCWLFLLGRGFRLPQRSHLRTLRKRCEKSGKHLIKSGNF